LTELDCTILALSVERIGYAYDLKNIIDLLRYLLPLPVPRRWRRRLIALGSGDPSRAICSALIADAFPRRAPIRSCRESGSPAGGRPREEILEIRHPRSTCRAISTSAVFTW